MANYYATARSNYFRVKDPEAFKKWAEELYLEVINQKTDAGETLYGVMTEGGDGWPSVRDVMTGPEGNEHPESVELDFPAELSKHLSDGEVAILMEVGSEKCRYLIGQSIAVASDGRITVLNINGIYQRASRAFRIPEANITRAEY